MTSLTEIRSYCASMPGATETVQWGNDHVFKIGGKMFAVIGIYSGKFHGMSFKVAPESFHILTREKDIIPAPYMSRAMWVMVEKLSALPGDQLKAYVARSHALVLSGLSKKLQAQFSGAAPAPAVKKKAAKKKAKKKAHV